MDWLKSNISTLAVMGATIAASYAVYGYRISAIEAEVMEQKHAIVEMRATNVDNQITLAEIQKDIEFIKIEVVKLNK